MEVTRKLESMKLIWEFASAWQKTKQEMLSRAYKMVLADSIHEEVLQIQWYYVISFFSMRRC